MSVYFINTSYIRSGEIDVNSFLIKRILLNKVLKFTDQTKKNIYEFKQVDSNGRLKYQLALIVHPHLIVLPKAIVGLALMIPTRYLIWLI